MTGLKILEDQSILAAWRSRRILSDRQEFNTLEPFDKKKNFFFLLLLSEDDDDFKGEEKQ